MRELTNEQMDLVSGGQLDGCSLPDVGSAAASFGVGGGLGITAGAATGKAAIAAAGGFIGTALVGAALTGFAIGVGINHALGRCS